MLTDEKLYEWQTYGYPGRIKREIKTELSFDDVVFLVCWYLPVLSVTFLMWSFGL